MAPLTRSGDSFEMRNNFMLHTVNVSTGIVSTGKPLAMRGFDAVSYFIDSLPRRGSADYAVDYGGATYYFATAANAQTFDDNPARYIPAYGGFCVYGTSLGKKFDGDPMIYRIINGRLYFSLSNKIANCFNANIERTIADADAIWPTIAEKSSGEL